MHRFVRMRLATYGALCCLLIAAGCDTQKIAEAIRQLRVLSLSVSPKSATVQVGQNVSLAATIVLEDNSTSDSAAWTSANTAVAIVSPQGVVTAQGPGVTRIRASRGEMTDSAAITVASASIEPVASVELTPSSASIEAGRTLQMTAVLRDAAGNILNRAVTWTSTNGSAATVSSTGLVTGVSAGSASIIATSEGKADTAAITVTAPPPPPPPPPPGTSCMSQDGPVVSVSGVRTSQYRNTDLADNTKVDASTAQIMTTETHGVIVGGGSNICYYRGEVLGYLPPSQDWSTMHDNYTFKVAGIPNFVLEGARHFDYGDGITIHENTSTNWVLRGVYFKYMRDDCIQNDWVNSGLVEDSFFDGCFQGFSSRPFSSTQDGSANVVTVRNSLFRLQHMDEGYSDPGHGGFFKWDAKGPMVSLHNNVYRVDERSQHSNHSFGPPAGKLKDCSNNVMIWLGEGPFPEQLPSCYRILTGQEGLDFWNAAAAQWKADHPPGLPDVGRPIIAMFTPKAAVTWQGTVTMTATAVDDRDGLGVQFQLSGQNIGALVTTESPLTKYSLTWDSRSVPNGVYTLTAVARDAAGNTRTTAGITVTIAN